MMHEKLLHYVWQNRLFNPIGMKVEGTGEEIEVINPGQLNTDAGPDFFNAIIRIGDTTWAGNVEIHNTSDDWYRHGHNEDPAYDNVILHIVGKTTGKQIVTSKGRIVAEAVVRYAAYIEKRYEEIGNTDSEIRCAKHLGKLTQMDRDAWIDRLILERFEELNSRVETLLEESGGDWDQTFYALLCRAMGLSVNALPMEILARKTPVRILIKHNDITQMEAILMGQAGLLPDKATDEYTAILKREYEVMKAKFDLKPMEGSEWKKLRMRPSNFPIIRLSQLAAIIHKTPGNFESAFRTLDVESLMDRFSVKASSYWDNHYEMGKESTLNRSKSIGKETQRLLVINTIIPFVFAYARRYSDERMQLNIIKMLSFLPMEKNSRITKWSEVGITPMHEGEAQALMLLYKNYCLKHKCLVCRWGHAVLARKE